MQISETFSNFLQLFIPTFFRTNAEYLPSSFGSLLIFCNFSFPHFLEQMQSICHTGNHSTQTAGSYTSFHILIIYHIGKALFIQHKINNN
jgi:hypothetical protein